MQLQILHLSCEVQRLPGYQAPWSVLLRNKMAECLALMLRVEDTANVQQ